jgi:hypothetical protein
VSRPALLSLSVVDCVFGVVYLTSDGSTADIALGVNFVLAALLAVLTAQDLRARNWTWPAFLIGASYLLAPLVGLVLYAIGSGRPKASEARTA